MKKFKLPQCFVVDHGEKFTEGRFVGTRVVFSGEVAQRFDPQVYPCMANETQLRFMQPRQPVTNRGRTSVHRRQRPAVCLW